ncbi:regulator of chromosome condensation (RCC1)-like protein [Achlya hypogyna]|uniref:Regulator of chromosome condensation (RCC1)-like protein n=1 Tax=Achlya hypogyna TaxID=1202772 RepID=A0A1V9ZSA9_ACHHY|nr:regulator of chromosome condensation (RCC1)-like protein [Achlya hypogyna]
MDDFSRQVRARIQLHAKLNEVKRRPKEYMGLSDKTVHSPGQTGCYCRDCLKFRKEEWRVGDINTSVVGPRDQWLMYHWGSAERGALCSLDEVPVLGPTLAPPIRETIVVEDAAHRRTKIVREAKFKSIASGKYHTLLLSESHQLFACGDNTYHALGTEPTPSVDDDADLAPISVMPSFPALGSSKVIAVAATAYASFALVDKPRDGSEEHEAKEKEAHVEIQSTRKKSVFVANENKDANEHNRVFSWGRGERGVLGHGSTAAEPKPRPIEALAGMRVTHIATGRQHVLALTEHHGLFAFGDGRYGKLGTGTVDDHPVPVRLDAFDRFFIASIGAGEEYSVALTDNLASRQVFVWGRGLHGVMGNGDEIDRLKPTRVGVCKPQKKIRAVACGGAHVLALSAIPTSKNGSAVYAWGAGGYGQLGHRDNWDSKVPRAIDELRSEKITTISAGARHSLALTVDGDIWVWGHGLHGYQPTTEGKMDISSPALLYPRRVLLPGVHIIGAVAGHERTFVWGDRAGYNESERVGGDTSLLSGQSAFKSYSCTARTVESSVCSAATSAKALSSDCLRVLYSCGTCHLKEICVVCAAKCHGQHAVALTWTLENCLSKECDCPCNRADEKDTNSLFTRPLRKTK